VLMIRAVIPKATKWTLNQVQLY